MQTRGIVRQVNVQGLVFVNVFSKLKRFCTGISREQEHLRKSNHPRKSPEKWTFLNSPFTMHRVCTLLTLRFFETFREGSLVVSQRLGKREHTPPCSRAELFFAAKNGGHRGKISVVDMVFLFFLLYPPPAWKVFLRGQRSSQMIFFRWWSCTLLSSLKGRRQWGPLKAISGQRLFNGNFKSWETVCRLL